MPWNKRCQCGGKHWRGVGGHSRLTTLWRPVPVIAEGDGYSITLPQANFYGGHAEFKLEMLE